MTGVRSAVLARAAPAALAALLAAKQLFVLGVIGFTSGHQFTMRAPVAIGCASIFVAVGMSQFRARWQAIAILASDAVLSAILLADALTFSQFGDVASVESLRYAHQLADVTDAIWQLVHPVHLLLFADLPALAYLLLWRIPPEGLRPARGAVPWALGAASAMVLASVVHTDRALRDGAQWEGHSLVARRAGPIAFHAMNAAAYARKLLQRPRGGEAEVAAVAAFLERRRGSEGAGAALRGTMAGRNVIVLQVESLQALALGRRVEGAPVAPRLDALRAESVSFDAFYHQAGEAHTSDADLAVNCSVYPPAHGSAYYEYSENDFRCLPRLLVANGYRTVAMQGIAADFWNLRTVYPRLGFSHFLARRDWLGDEIIGMGLSDRTFLRQAAERLVVEEEPFYAFVVTLTSHTPFRGLPRTLPLGALSGTVLGDYLNAIHYTDAAVGDFVERLRASGLLDRSLLIVYGDHDGIGRRTGLDPSSASASDPSAWFEVERRVPLIVRFPRGAHAAHRGDPAAQVDLAPTIASLLGVDEAEATFFGRDLFAGAGGAAVFFPDGTALDDRYLALPDGAGAGCFGRADGGPVAADACAALARRGAFEVALSRRMLGGDLAGRVVATRRQRPGAERAAPAGRTPPAGPAR